MRNLETKSGYYYSIALHAGIAVSLAAFAFMEHIFNRPSEEPPLIFQMVEPIPEAPLRQVDQTPKQEVVDINEPDLPDVKPIDLPDPQPEPTPEPKPEPKPSPKPEPKPDKRISITEFRKLNPDKKRTNNKPTRRRSVKVDKIVAKTDNLAKFSETTISSNVGASSAMKNVLGAYVRYINAVAKRNWVKPESTTGLELSCTLQFKVGISGAISGVRIIRGSGNSDFDNSTLRLFRALRVDPPPDGQAHTVKLEFTTEK